jgi:hypothetical protein
MIQSARSRRGYLEGSFVKWLYLGRRMDTAPNPLQNARFVLRKSNLGMIDKLQGVLVAGVEAFAENPPTTQGLGRQLEQLRQPAGER